MESFLLAAHVQQDSRLLILASGLCYAGSLTALTIVHRSFSAGSSGSQRWLFLAGIVTGVAIWTTHFTATLAYDPGLDLRIDPASALGSLTSAVLICIVGWITASRGPTWKGAVGGSLIGVALAIAHFLDMDALRFRGTFAYRPDLTLLAIVGGILLFAVVGWRARRHPTTRLPLVTAFILSCGVLFLHFTAMLAMTAQTDAASVDTGLQADLKPLAGLVIAGGVLILLIGVGVIYHDRRLARLTAEDRERLRQSEEHHRYSVELSSQIPWIGAPDGSVLELSPRWYEVVGQPVKDALGMGWMEVIHPDDLPATLEHWHLARETGTPADIRYRLKQRDGSFRWFRASARARVDNDGRIIKWYGSLEDIHEQVKAELALRESEERYRLASRATNDIICDWSIESQSVAWSEAVATVLGYPDALEGTTADWFNDRIHPDDRDHILEGQRELLASARTQWSSEHRFRAADGRYLHMLSRGHVVRNEAGEPVRIVGALLDITAARNAEQELRWAAHHDHLTQLPNRALFAQRLEGALEKATETSSVALIVLDVDHFKMLNDAHGHFVGDALLCEMSRRLSLNLPAQATVSRLGGDEFAMIIPEITPSDLWPDTVEPFLHGMDEPFLIDGRAIAISVSAGAALAPQDASDPEGLLKCADLALYAVKAESPGLIKSFKPQMRHAADTENQMLSNTREALRDDRIIPFYQPKVCLRTGTIRGFEALLRWHHDFEGLQPPSTIEAAFHDSDLSVQITNRMLDSIIIDMSRWRDQGINFGRIAVNGSASDFRRGDFAERILTRLERADLSPSLLELEITESVFIGKLADLVSTTLNTLCEAGVTIALDDFGTGYASLTHLKQFPVDEIKIDRSFVATLTHTETDDAAIVAAVIDLAHNLNIATVAEGVETAAQAAHLMVKGCDMAQGYFFGRAMAALRVTSFLASWDAQAMLKRCTQSGWEETLRKAHPDTQGA